MYRPDFAMLCNKTQHISPLRIANCKFVSNPDKYTACFKFKLLNNLILIRFSGV